MRDQLTIRSPTAVRLHHAQDLPQLSVSEDRAVSGASTVNRSGFADLMRAAEHKEFNAIFVEDVDRLARDQSDYHAARKRLDFLGIAIYTASGVVSRIDGSLRALMGEMFIENLATHTRRGMEADRAGRSGRQGLWLSAGYGSAR